MAAFDPFWGPYDTQAGWVPSLRYLLRRARILTLAREWPRGKLLEVGCGSGALLIELAAMGFDCTGLETSAPARNVAEILASCHAAQGLAILAESSSQWQGQFDYITAFDVLEHIADDRGALAQWIRWLRPGGRLLVSVPAHSHRWGPGDEWAGHHRRYDKAPLLGLLADFGLKVEHIECYGFPFANLSERLGARYYRRALAQRTVRSHEHASALSGVTRQPWIRIHGLMRSWPGKAVVSGALALQKAFLGTDWGSGYLVVARRPCDA